jgi:phage protein D
MSAMGTYVVDEVEESGAPSVVKIRGTASPRVDSGLSKAMQTQRNKSWSMVTIGVIVQTIAARLKLVPIVSTAFQSEFVKHLSQTGESDIHFLVRLAKENGAFVKPASGKLIFMERGKAVSASGIPLPPITINYADVSSWRYIRSKRDAVGTVTAQYWDKKEGATGAISVGSGEPIKMLKYEYATKQNAKKAAKAELAKLKSSQDKVSLTLPGNPDLVAEVGVKLVGFPPAEMNTSWVVARGAHNLSNSGYSTSIDLEGLNE